MVMANKCKLVDASDGSLPTEKRKCTSVVMPTCLRIVTNAPLTRLLLKSDRCC